MSEVGLFPQTNPATRMSASSLFGGYPSRQKESRNWGWSGKDNEDVTSHHNEHLELLCFETHRTRSPDWSHLKVEGTMEFVYQLLSVIGWGLLRGEGVVLSQPSCHTRGSSCWRTFASRNADGRSFKLGRYALKYAEGMWVIRAVPWRVAAPRSPPLSQYLPGRPSSGLVQMSHHLWTASLTPELCCTTCFHYRNGHIMHLSPC